MRKYILMLVICVSSFMIYTNNVKATTYYDFKHFNDNYITCSTGYGYCQENLNIFKNNGNISGDLMFTFVSDPQIIVNSVVVYNANNSAFTCNIGSQTIYSDNTNGYHLFTAICPGNANNSGFTKIRFNYDDQYYNGNSFKFYISDYYSFTFDATNTDYTAILNTINNSVNNLNTALGGKLDNVYNYVSIISSQISIVNGKLDIANSNLSDIKSKLDDIKNNSSATASNTQEIKEKINDSSIDNNNATGTINNLSGQLASDNTISSLLLLPINFINVLIDGLSGECVPYSLGELWGSEIVLPCINLYNTFGAIWYMVDTGLSALVIFKMSKYFIRLFNKLTNLKDGGLEEAYS